MQKILLVIAIMMLGSTCLAQTAFDKCGIIEDAFDCTNLRLFTGQAYELKTLPPNLNFGDTVRVFGTFISGASLCMSGGSLCCVYVDSTVPCSAPAEPVPVPASTPVGILILGLLVIGSGAILLYRRLHFGSSTTS